MKDVQFVTTVERPDAPPIEYRSDDVSSKEPTDGLIEISHEITVANYGSDWIVKTYVWNVGKKEFEILDLKLIVQN